MDNQKRKEELLRKFAQLTPQEQGEHFSLLLRLIIDELVRGATVKALEADEIDAAFNELMEDIDL